MRSSVGLASLAAAVVASLVAPSARAADCTGFLTACINDDTLWPHAGPSRFAAIGSSETVAPGQVSFGLVTSYLNRPVVLSTQIGTLKTNQYAISDQANGTFLWSYGVTERLELDLMVPLTFGQGGTGLAPITGGTGLKDTASRDMRFGFAYALIAHPRVSPTTPPGDGFGLTGRFEVSAPTGDIDEFAGEQTGVAIPSLAGDWRRGRFFVGAELGARIRPTNEVLGARVGTQLVTALGAGYDLLPVQWGAEPLTVTVEAWALPTFAQQHAITNPEGVYLSTPDNQYIAPAEWQLSVRTAPLPGGDLSIQGGVGTGIPLSGGTFPMTQPDFRAVLGIRWAPLRYDSDHDGVPDAEDRCPGIPAHTRNGCPAPPETPPAPATTP